nr:LysR family transcriptional regulator [Acidovorax sp. D4N7]
MRYFIKICELGSMGRAASELDVVTSALSQQISRLESELSTRLLQRSPAGVIPTEAGMAFMHHALLALRNLDNAAQAAKQARLSGQVSVGFAPTTASVLGLPFQKVMRERYPDIRLHLVEALSGNLAGMLNARRIDLGIIFKADAHRHWHTSPLLEEKLFLVASPAMKGLVGRNRVFLSELADVPLVLPSATHGLRALVDAGFMRAGVIPHIALEVDGLALLMDTVMEGQAASIQPGAATTRHADAGLLHMEIADDGMGRQNLLASLSDEDLSPAALAARVVIAEVVRATVCEGRWKGALLAEA